MTFNKRLFSASGVFVHLLCFCVAGLLFAADKPEKTDDPRFVPGEEVRVDANNKFIGGDGAVEKLAIRRLRLLRFARNDIETHFLSLRGAHRMSGEDAEFEAFCEAEKFNIRQYIPEPDYRAKEASKSFRRREENGNIVINEANIKASIKEMYGFKRYKREWQTFKSEPVTFKNR